MDMLQDSSLLRRWNPWMQNGCCRLLCFETESSFHAHFWVDGSRFSGHLFAFDPLVFCKKISPRAQIGYRTINLVDIIVHNWFLSSKINNKRDIHRFVQWPWKWGQRSNSRSPQESPYMTSYLNVLPSKLYLGVFWVFSHTHPHYEAKSHWNFLSPKKISVKKKIFFWLEMTQNT